MGMDALYSNVMGQKLVKELEGNECNEGIF